MSAVFNVHTRQYTSVRAEARTPCLAVSDRAVEDKSHRMAIASLVFNLPVEFRFIQKAEGFPKSSVVFI